MKRSVIGIPVSINNQNGKMVHKLYARYEEYLHHFDITSLLITPLNSSYVLPIIDGLLLIGGDDVNPLIYKKPKMLANIDDYQDNFEFSVIHKALLLKKPIFGICRGIQIINVYFNGTLKNVLNHNKGNHLIINKNEKVANKLVNSYHAQAIDKLGRGLSTLYISNDKIIEGIIDKKRMIFAVQYHPELTYDDEFIKIMKSLL